MLGPIDKVEAVAGQNDIADSQKTAIAKLPCNEHVATQPKTLSGYDRFDAVVLFVEFQLRWPDGAADSVACRSGRSLPVTPSGRTCVGQGPADLDTWQIERVAPFLAWYGHRVTATSTRSSSTATT